MSQTKKGDETKPSHTNDIQLSLGVKFYLATWKGEECQNHIQPLTEIEHLLQSAW